MPIKDKIIAFDLDGTFVGYDGNVSDYTINETKKLIEQGYKITIVTGRATISSRLAYESCNMQLLSVHNNGAVLYNYKKEEKIRNVTIPMDVVKNIIDDKNLMSHVDDLMIEIGEQVYSLNGNKNWNPKQIVGDFRNTLPCEPNSIVIWAKSKEEQKVIYDIVNQNPDYHYRYWGFTGELYSTHFTKKEGVEALLAYYNLNPSDLIFFGDGENDIETLQYAGIGIAMKNAPDDVKSFANLITDLDNGQDGAIKYLLKMIEEEKK